MRNSSYSTSAALGAGDSATLTDSSDAWDAIAVVVDEGEAAAGVLTITVKYAGMSSYVAPSSNTYTIGTSTGFKLSNVLITGVRIQADSNVDADVTAVVHWMRQG